MHDEIENVSFVVDGVLQKDAFAVDAADHLVKMPARRWRRSAAAEFGSDLRTQLHRPASDGFVAGAGPTLSEKCFDVSKAEGEAEVEPGRMSDHIGWKR